MPKPAGPTALGLQLKIATTYFFTGLYVIQSSDNRRRMY